MGKNGRALREAKKQQVYTFTREQLEARDRALLNEQKQIIMKKMEAEARKREAEIKKNTHDFLEREFKAREELLRAGDDGLFENLMQYLVAVPSRVLIERFNWKPLRKDGKYKKKFNIDKFNQYILEELNAISNDEMKDIRTYADEVFELYGVKIEAVEVDE